MEYLEGVDREYSSRVRHAPDGDHSDYLSDAVRLAPDVEQRRHIQSILVREFQRLGRYSEAEAVLLALTSSEGAGAAYTWAQFAEHYHYCDVNLTRALETIERAVVEAKRTGEFVFHNLGIKARIGTELENWKVVEDALWQALSHRHQRGMPDVQPETDFLARIPPGAVPGSLLSRYRAFANNK